MVQKVLLQKIFIPPFNSKIKTSELITQCKARVQESIVHRSLYACHDLRLTKAILSDFHLEIVPRWWG